jgi:carotenoid cleavage dioxygenase-like enzyme
VLNAWEENGKLFADVMQYDAPPLFPRADGAGVVDGPARLVRWPLDLAGNTDAIVRTPLDDLPGEFPRVDDRLAGLKNRFGAIAASSSAEAGLDAIAWFDLARGSRALFALPAGDATSEPVFVPRAADAAEGDGWLLAVVWRAAEHRSDLIVLDTQAIKRGPVAAVQLSHRVPFGFHANFVPAEALA